MIFDLYEYLHIINSCDNIQEIDTIVNNLDADLMKCLTVNSSTTIYIIKIGMEYLIVCSNIKKSISQVRSYTNFLRDKDRELVFYKNKHVRVNAYLFKLYLSIIDDFQYSITKIMEKERFYPTKFYFIGFGIAAGLQTLLSLEIARKFSCVMPILITFGSIRVGGKKFCKLLNKYVEKNQRIILSKDPVVYYPSKLEGFRHPNDALILNKSGDVCNFYSINVKNKYHNIPMYINAVKNYEKKLQDKKYQNIKI